MIFDHADTLRATYAHPLFSLDKNAWHPAGELEAAGTLKFNNGSIRAVTNASGHYLPTPGEGMNFLRLFKANGADISNATLSMYHDVGTLFKEILPSSPVRKLYD